MNFKIIKIIKIIASLLFAGFIAISALVTIDSYKLEYLLSCSTDSYASGGVASDTNIVYYVFDMTQVPRRFNFRVLIHEELVGEYIWLGPMLSRDMTHFNTWGHSGSKPGVLDDNNINFASSDVTSSSTDVTFTNNYDSFEGTQLVNGEIYFGQRNESSTKEALKFDGSCWLLNVNHKIAPYGKWINIYTAEAP